MKDGYVVGGIAGLIAGLVTGIFAIGSQFILANIGLQPAIILEEFLSAAITHIGMTTIWAVIFGIIYAIFYHVIPGNGVKKGLVFGFIIYLLADLWITSYQLARGWPGAYGYVITGFPTAIIYGPLLGLLYESSKQSVQFEDKIKHKVIAGPIAGIAGGIVAFVLQALNSIMGHPYASLIPIPNLAAIEIILMVVWGAILSIIFVMFYPRIPGRGVMKGLYFGLLLSLICVAHSYIWWYPMGTPLEIIVTIAIPYVLAFITYGLVLGYLYKK